MSRREYQRTKDGRYRSQLRDPVTRKRVSISARTVAELERKKHRVLRVRSALELGEIEPEQAVRALRPKLTKVSEIWALYIPTVSAASTPAAKANWNNRLKPYFGDANIYDLDEPRIRQWARKLEAAGFAPKTIVNAWDNLRAAYRQAVNAGHLRRFPWGEYAMKTPEVRRPREAIRDVGELERLLRVALERDVEEWRKGRYADLYFRVAVLCLTGMRQAELAGLGWDFVLLDSTPPMLRIEYQAKKGWPKRWPLTGRSHDEPKNGRRVHVLHDDAVKILELQWQQLKAHGRYRADGPVFPGRADRWRTSGVTLKPVEVRKLVERAGIPNIRDWVTHSLRHSFTSLESKHSGDLKATMKRNGDRTMSAIQTYIHPTVRVEPSSAIPRLALGALPALEAPAQPSLLEPAVIVEPRQFEAAGVRALTREAKRQQKEARAGELAARKRDADRPLEELAAEYVRAGDDGPDPPGACVRFRRAYQRAYEREKRRGCTPGECQKAGERAKRAARGAWAQALSRARRVASAAKVPPALPESTTGDGCESA